MTKKVAATCLKAISKLRAERIRKQVCYYQNGTAVMMLPGKEEVLQNMKMQHKT